MDEIQRVLIKAGRKDLAQKYYKKIAGGISLDSIAKQVYDLLKHKRDWEKDAEKALRFSFHLSKDKVEEVMGLLRSEDFFDTSDKIFAEKTAGSVKRMLEDVVDKILKEVDVDEKTQDKINDWVMEQSLSPSELKDVHHLIKMLKRDRIIR